MAGAKDIILVGPWGGNGGNAWDDGIYDGIREITIVHDGIIDSIRVVYDKNGVPVAAEKHGGDGGSKTAVIKLEFPGEFLTNVSGHINHYNGIGPLIGSLTLKSNKRTFGPYGIEQGTPFSVPMEGGKIVGLKGSSGWYLDSIAFHVTPIHTNNQPNYCAMPPLLNPLKLLNPHQHPKPQRFRILAPTRC